MKAPFLMNKARFMDDTYLNPLTPILEGGNRVFPLRSGENEFGASRRKRGMLPPYKLLQVKNKA
jgi:hypothetical protein